MRRLLVVWTAWLCLAGAPASAAAPGADDRARLAQQERIEGAVRLMAALSRDSRINAARIRAAYAPEIPHLMLDDRAHLTGALRTGRIVPLPVLPGANVALRLRGAHPIGEHDRAAQHLYVAARPETLGCLLHVASRVRSGALEVTSLVRHGAYQSRLARHNPNATTSVPTHAMGLAFDISVLNVPVAVAREIRDVLRKMASAGELFFIAEQRQLVFHVVPAPARRPYYAAVFETLANTPLPPTLEPSWPVPGLVPAPSGASGLARFPIFLGTAASLTAIIWLRFVFRRRGRGSDAAWTA